MSVLFKGGTVVNASGRYLADVLADGNIIKAIGTDLDNPADEIVDVLLTPPDQTPRAPENPVTPENARLQHIEAVFQEAGHNVSLAARLLNMHRRTLQRILKRNGVMADAAR